MRFAIAALLCTMSSGATAKGRVVRWAHAEASKAIYKGQCPVRLVFTGTILAAGRYRLLTTSVDLAGNVRHQTVYVTLYRGYR